eukprot:3347553-Pyramimonas_sp.AAC.1
MSGKPSLSHRIGLGLHYRSAANAKRDTKPTIRSYSSPHTVPYSTSYLIGLLSSRKPLKAGGDIVVELVVADHHLVPVPLADSLVRVVLVTIFVVGGKEVVGGDLLHLYPGCVLHRP